MKCELPIGLFKIPIPANEYYNKKTYLEYLNAIKDSIQQKMNIELPIFTINGYSGIFFPNLNKEIDTDNNTNIILFLNYKDTNTFSGSNKLYITFTSFKNKNKNSFNDLSEYCLNINPGNNNSSSDAKDKILLIDTRFLDSHNFYSLGYASEVQPLYPFVHISNFIDIRDNSNKLGINFHFFQEPIGITNASYYYDIEGLEEVLEIKKLQSGYYISKNFYNMDSTDFLKTFCSNTILNKEEETYYRRFYINGEAYLISPYNTKILFKEKGE